LKTHNVSIYHCIACGRVMQAELKAKPPQCCGKTMAKSAADAIREGDVAGKDAADRSETAPPAIKGRTKPR
jgi:hypothetical protein